MGRAVLPWTPTYLELAQEQFGIARQHHPNCKVWLAQQGLYAGEARQLLDWLDSERPQWVEAVVYRPFSEGMTFPDPLEEEDGLSLERYSRSGPLSAPVNRLRAAVPGQYQVILYPDETHTFRSQYPAVGMDAAVQHVWGREDGPSPRPREMATIHAATSPASDGAIPHSEGNTDDLNKFISSALCWNPFLSAEEIVHQYARWFFGPLCAQEAAELALKLEEALSGPL